MPRESAALYLWRAALLVSCSSTARGPRGDGVEQCRVDVDVPRHASGDGGGRSARRSPRHRSQKTTASKKKKKNVFRSTSSEEYTRKTDGRRRPMPQQIWKGPEIKIHDAPPRRRRALYATTNLLAASLVYA